MMIHPEVWLGDHGGEESCVTSEAASINDGWLIDIHAAIQQPASDLDLVVVGAHVKQSRAGKRRSVRRQHLIVTAELGRVDLFVGEGSLEQIRITAQMLFEQIDAAAVQSHRQCIGQLKAMLYVELQNAVLGRWIAAVSLEHRVDGRKPISLLVVQARAKLEQECRARHIESV